MLYDSNLNKKFKTITTNEKLDIHNANWIKYYNICLFSVYNTLHLLVPYISYYFGHTFFLNFSINFLLSSIPNFYRF
jgi:hypothetical protein